MSRVYELHVHLNIFVKKNNSSQGELGPPVRGVTQVSVALVPLFSILLLTTKLEPMQIKRFAL